MIRNRRRTVAGLPWRFVLLHGLILFVSSILLTYFMLDRVGIGQAVVLSAALTGCALLFMGIEWRAILHDLSKLEESARRITAGQYGHEILSVTVSDLGELMRTFNAMSSRLAEQFSSVDQERQQLRAILDGMIEGVVAIDAQQRLLFANDRGSQLLEFNPKTALGLRFWEIVRQRPMVSLVDRAIETAEPQREEFDWRGNPSKSLLIHVSPLREKPGGAIIVIHDTSELRRLERLRHEFVANVSHELKTPLAIIQAAVETLRDGAVDDPAHRETFLEQIHDQTIRLNHLILDLLSLARIESGRETMEIRRVGLVEVVQDCLDRHRAQAEARRQTLQMVPPVEKSSQELWTDEEALAQILDNLVGNAIRYGHDGGHVTVRWYGLGDQIAIEVTDDGPGIPPDDLPRIFERFYRVDKARSRELGGTGLGLSIVKNLVQIMKGSVKVQSTLGQGTTFTVALPRTPR
jgi:two-component system phosphate regulon sensor histidine kinase PhoR